MPWVAPVLVAEWAPGFGPRDANPTWVTLPKLRDLSFKRGRQRELDQMQPAAGSLVIGGNDNPSLDPLAPGSLTATLGVPFTPIRVTATYDGVPYRVFTGVTVDSWKPVGGVRGRDQPFEVEIVDFLGWGALVPLPPSRWQSLIAANDPLTWVTGELSRDPAGNRDFAIDRSNNSLSGIFGGSTRGARSVKETTSPTQDSSLPGVVLSDPFESVPQAIFVSGLTGSAATNSVFSIGFWFSTTAGDFRTIIRGQDNNLTVWEIKVGSTGAVFAALCKLDGTVLANAVANSRRYDTGAPIFVAVVWERSARRITLRVRGLDSIVNDDATITASTTAQADLAIGSSGVQVGGLLSGDTGTAVTIADFAAFNSVPVGLMEFWNWLTGPADQMGSSLGKGNLVTTRVGFVLDLMRATVPVDPLSSTLPLDTFEPKSNGGDALLSLGEGLNGATYIRRDGTMVVLDWGTIVSDPAFNVPTHALTDAPVPPGTPTPVRYVSRGRTGRQVGPVVNEVEVTTGVGDYRRRSSRALDFASQDQYGLKRWIAHSNAVFADDVGFIPADVIARYKDPQIELDAVTVEPWGDDAATRFVLSPTTDLLRAVQYVESPPAGSTTPVLDKACRIQGEDWSWSDNNQWRVSYQLQPIVPSSAVSVGLSFRATSGYVTGAPAETATTANYPRLTQGIQVGWKSPPSGTRDRSTTVDARLAGVAFSSTEATYRLDVGIGTVFLTLAAGDAAVTQGAMRVDIFDNRRLIAQMSGTMSAGEFIDATGVKRLSAAAWVSSNQPRTVQVKTGILLVKIVATTGTAVLAHVAVSR